MTCSWFLEHVHAYAVGALDAVDRALMEQHLEHEGPHEDCFAVLADALECVQTLDSGLPPAQPGDDVWQRIALEIEGGDDLSTAPPQATAAMSPRRAIRREVLGWGFAIAATLVLVNLYRTTTNLEAQLQQKEQQLARMNAVDDDRRQCAASLEQIRELSDTSREVLALLEEPNTRVVPFQAQAGHGDRASVVLNVERSRAYVLSLKLPRLPEKDYQLWVIRGSAAPVPAGFVHIGSDGAAIGEFDAKLLQGSAPDALAVSIEPKGGRPTPTEVILVAKL